MHAPLPLHAELQPPKVLLPDGVAVNVTLAPVWNAKLQAPVAVPPLAVQLIPLGDDVMVPEPVPFAAMLSCAVVDGADPNDALTATAWLIVTEQDPVPLQPLLHPPKLLPLTGNALSVTFAPEANEAEHVPLVVPALTLQLTPAGLDVTEPEPAPVAVTVRRNVGCDVAETSNADDVAAVNPLLLAVSV